MNFLTFIVTCTLLAYIPVAVYLDLRYRRFPVDFWKPLYFIGAPITFYLYITKAYDPIAIPFSLIFIGIYFTLWVYDVYQGADFMYLAAIALFLVQTPKGDPIASIAYSLYLIASVVMVAVFLVGSKIVIKKLDMPKEVKPKWVNDLEHLQSIPFMVQISMALVFTVVFA